MRALGAAVPVTDLPPSAQGMYATWWNTVAAWAQQTDPATGGHYGAAVISEAASQLARDFPQTYPSYSPPGVSALYRVALQVAGSAEAITAASPDSPITDQMVARPPWSRPDAEISAMPVWQARAEITYLDPEGNQLTGISTVTIPQVLPSTVGSLQAQMELRVTDQLSSPPGTGTPRSGTLISVDSITLLAV